MTSLHEPASALDRLPADQRAVLQMVLGRGHSYDEIARLLSIDRAAVRERALSALDTMGPATRIPAQRRALVTDYLLGQLPPRVTEEVRDHLGRSASERAWARVVASELQPLSPEPLPEIPAGELEPEVEPDAGVSKTHERDADGLPRDQGVGAAEDERRVSKLGGAILLGAVAAAVIAAILIFVVFGVGGGTTHKASAAHHPATTTSPRTSAKPLAQINLASPTHTRAVGIAQVIKVGNATGVAIVAAGLKPNSHGDAYAIWLYNSPSSSYRLGYVNPGVGSNGRLQTAGRLPANAGSYKQIVVALQNGPSNKPGTIVLEGHLSGV